MTEPERTAPVAGHDAVIGLAPRGTFLLRPGALIPIVVLAVVFIGSISVLVTAGDELSDDALTVLVLAAILSPLLLGLAVSIPLVMGPNREAATRLRDRFPSDFVTVINGTAALDESVRSLETPILPPLRAGSNAWLLLEPDSATVWVRHGPTLVCALTVERDRIIRSRIDLVIGATTSGAMGVILSVRSHRGETVDLRILPTAERMAAPMRLVRSQENRNAAINHWAKTGAST